MAKSKKQLPKGMVGVEEAVSHIGKGFESVKVLPGSTYKDNSTIIVVPTRGKVDTRVIAAWQNLICPMNQKRAFIFAVGDEVGIAYDKVVKDILADPNLSKWPYIMTMEDDNLPPPDAHIRLLESIEFGKYDAVSGIYFTKGEFNMPMAYGDPDEYARTKILDFKPRDIRQALSQNNTVMPVNGIAMGCALWRLDIFRQIQPPWFQTVADLVNGSPTGFTQDLYFCKNAVQAGKRFAVDLRVKVGHMDINTGTVY